METFRMFYNFCLAFTKLQKSQYFINRNKMFSHNIVLFLLLLLLLLLSIVEVASSKSIIKSLPGFPGNLPFLLETGYIGVGELDEEQLFYYFIESERSPNNDPLVLWLTGGPGCSGLFDLIYEIGPLTFDYAKSSGGNRPVLMLKPYSWTKVANIIFVDAPVGTGFSYSTTWQGYQVSDTSSAAQLYEFLRKWLMDHPKFLANPLYIAGVSYSGIIVPIVVQHISNGIEAGAHPPMNLKGYALGNPLTDYEININSRVTFAHRTALVSDKLYQSFKKNCKGEYLNPNQSNALCMGDIVAINASIGKVHIEQILEPSCIKRSSPKPTKWDPSILTADYTNTPLLNLQLPEQWCRSDNYVYVNAWANDKTVQEALHIRQGTKNHWERCNRTMAYSEDVASVIDYHRNLTKKPYRALVYCGDHDMVFPYIGTNEWIQSLNLTIDDDIDWEPWFVDGQVAGYTTLYSYSADYTSFELTFATVKGAGHAAPEYNPQQCLAMIDRWFAFYPL